VYRWAENQFDRLPELAAELVRRRVAVIAANNTAILPAKAATTNIPIVFIVAEDPVRTGLVASLARPSGNLTGINFFSGELTAKRLELLRELVPAVARVAVLVSPTGPLAETTLRDVEPAARAMGLQTNVLNASTSREIDEAFERLDRMEVHVVHAIEWLARQPRRAEIVDLVIGAVEKVEHIELDAHAVLEAVADIRVHHPHRPGACRDSHERCRWSHGAGGAWRGMLGLCCDR
jgi:putative ABC transport system substrate-binding protein